MSESNYIKRILQICSPDYISDDIAIIDDIRSIKFGKSDYIPDGVIIIFVRSGYMTLDINSEHLHVSTRQFLLCRPGLNISTPTFSDDFSGHGLILSMRYGQSIISVAGNIWDFLISIDAKPIISIPDSVRVIMLEYYRLLKLEVNHRNNAYYDDVINSIVRSMLYSLISDIRNGRLLNNIDINQLDQGYKGSKQSLSLFHGFIDILLNDKYIQRKIDYYAQRLCVTPKYLSTVCRQVSNRTAHEWICDALVNAISNELKFSDLSIKEISEKYGFTTLSFFSKFVKDHLGKSPSEIRKLL